MKAGMAVIRRHGQKVDDVLSALEGYAEECLQGQVPLPFGSPLSTEPMNSWSLSALDWAGWDWNDLSYLFENSE